MSSLQQLAYDDLRSIDQGGAEWHAYRKAVCDSLYFAAKAVFSQIPRERNLITMATHYPLCLALQAVNDGEISRVLISDPRRFLKSTLATTDRPVHKLCQRVVRQQDPSDRFGLRSFSALNSYRFWRDIKDIFERNQLFQHLFPELIPDFKTVLGWNQSEGTIPRDYNPKEPTFDCLGGGPAASRHYDDISEDDYINEENYDSPAAIEKAIEYHKQSENLLEDPRTGVIVTIGNFWGLGDLNSYICAHEPGTAVFNRGALHGPYLEGRWACRGLPESVTELLKQLPQGEPLWPERFDREALGQLLSSLKPRIFMAQMENNPTDPESTDFRLEWLKECEVKSVDGEPCLIYYGKDGQPEDEPTALANCNVYLTWDPALDGRHSTSRNAVLVTSIDWRGRVAVIREHAKKEDPRDSLNVFLAFARAYAGYLRASGVEEVLFAKVLGDILRERAAAARVFLNLRKLKVPRGMEKDQRIRAWAGDYFERGMVYCRRGLVEFPQEYANFGVQGATRDLMDAFAHATRLFRKPPSPDAVRRQERRAAQVAIDRGATGYGSALRLPGAA